MSNTRNNSLLAKLLQLQCQFTWKPQRDNFDLDEVKQKLEDSIKIDGVCQGMPHNQLAFINCLQGNYEEATQNLKEAEKFLRENHKDEFERRCIVTYGNYAWVHYHMGQLTEAQSYLDKLEMICKPLTEGPWYTAMIPEVYGEKGWSLLSSAADFYEEAKECFEKVLEKSPDTIEWNMGYATVLTRLESFTEIPENQKQSRSVKQLKHVLELDPDNSVAMVMLALKLQEFKQTEANELVERALQKSPYIPYVLRYAAKFYRKEKEIDKSIELLEKALKYTPHSAFLHHQIGLCCREKLLSINRHSGNLADDKKAELISQCKYWFEQTFKIKPSFIIARLDFAGICLINGEIQRAKEIYKHLLGLENIASDKRQAIVFQAGLFELYYNKSESNAIDYFLEGLKIKLGSKQWRLCYDKLEMIATRQIHRNPRDSVAYGKLGLMHQLAGKNYKAIELFEKALTFDPGNEDYLSALCKLRFSI